MILVTGAAGKTGQAVIRALCRMNKPVRALVHKVSQVQQIQALGAREVLTGDLCSQAQMNRVCREIKAVYHICPNVHPGEFRIGQTLMKAARAAGVEHFIYHSVFHPQVKAMPHHWQKMRVEEKLFESGLRYTILQPAPYMQNILAYWNDIVQNHTYAVPYPENTRLSLVDLEDVAEVAALVSGEPAHAGAIYELCGPDNLSPVEIAHIISQHLGQKIAVKEVPIEEWQSTARQRGLGDYPVKTLSKMFHYYEQFGFYGNPRVLSCLLGRAPTPFATFVERMLKNGINTTTTFHT